MSQKIIKILLIEDDSDDALVTEKVLKKGETAELRFEIVRVECLEKGIDLLTEGRFQLVLLDLSLPDSHGFDTFLKVREAEPNVPIVICSGLEDEQLAIQAISRGAQDYVVKGQINQRGFEKIVRYALERQKIQEMKEEFVGMVIHDLRSPLVIAREAINQIMDGMFGAVPDTQKTFLRMAMDGMKRLERMVNDLLEVTRGELGKIKLELEPANLIDVIHEIVTGFQVVAKKRELRSANIILKAK